MNETVSSTGDARTTNNTMRHQYRVLSEEEKVVVDGVKRLGTLFLLTLDDAKAVLAETNISTDVNREFAIARTKIEEAVMWAVKGITK